MQSFMQAVQELKLKMTDKEKKGMDWDRLLRTIQRLENHEAECADCHGLKESIYEGLQELQKAKEEIPQEDWKTLKDMDEKIRQHLQKDHGLVEKGQYMALYMSLGMALGLPVGMLFGNMAMGIPIGLSVGLALGVSMDQDAEKKGRTI